MTGCQLANNTQCLQNAPILASEYATRGTEPATIGLICVHVTNNRQKVIIVLCRAIIIWHVHTPNNYITVGFQLTSTLTALSRGLSVLHDRFDYLISYALVQLDPQKVCQDKLQCHICPPLMKYGKQ